MYCTCRPNVSYLAQYALWQWGHSAGVRPSVSSLAAMNASRLSLLHFSAAQRGSFAAGSPGFGAYVVSKREQACSSGWMCSLQKRRSQRHLIGRKSFTLQRSRAQCAPTAAISAVDIVICELQDREPNESLEIGAKVVVGDESRVGRLALAHPALSSRHHRTLHP